MSLEIVRIHSTGDASKEFILLKALESIDLSKCAVVATTFDDKNPNVFRLSFVFPPFR